MRVLLVNPPISDPSGPYPSICYLAGFLDTLGITADLADASLMLMLRLFSRSGLQALHQEITTRIEAKTIVLDPGVQAFLAHFQEYVSTVDTAIACLQGTELGAVARANRPGYFPTAVNAPAAWAQATSRNVQNYDALLGGLTPAQRARIASMPRPFQFAFGTLGEIDEARFRASCVIGDLAHVIQTAIDPEFTLDGYADRLPDDSPTFAPLGARLEQPPGLIDRLTDDISGELWRAHRPDVVGLTAPFPGSVYGALRLARRFKMLDPQVRTVLGGGWVNTNLRDLTDAGIFSYVDFITLDDGERPLQCLLEMVKGERTEDQLLRTWVRRGDRVVQINGATEADVPFVRTGVPTYRGLPLREYLTLRSATNMRPRIGGRRWNKLTLAHGCYWKKCAFCDTQLDYIGRYEPASLDVTLARIRSLIAETGESGFHFVDEAMPPALLERFAERLIGDELQIAWWGNVRFDRKLESIAPLLAKSGCIAITGGLEVASDRLLALMQKGVSLDQAARVTHALSQSGMNVHAYLIYGFPTQTAQETIDALEYVRQLFEAGCLHSIAWHRFMLTKFSPIALDPARFSIQIRPQELNPFCNCVLQYDEPGGIDHDQFKSGLEEAAYTYMAGLGWDRPVESWFPTGVPKTTLAPDFVARLISRPRDEAPLPTKTTARGQWALSVT
jgi:radical SAM superfamily enzyme YgiQ (UPF0313 family)